MCIYIYKCSHCYCNSFNKSFSLKTKHCVPGAMTAQEAFSGGKAGCFNVILTCVVCQETIL